MQSRSKWMLKRFNLAIGTGLVAVIANLAAAQDAPGRPPQDPARPGAGQSRQQDETAPQQQRRQRLREALQERQQNQDRAQNARVPATVQDVQEVVYATAPTKDGGTKELLLDAYFPKQSGEDPLPAIVYIHGGGFVGGDKAVGRAFSIALAQGGYFAVTIAYRLADEAPLPAAMEDCKAAVRFLRANAAELGIDPDRIGVWGHSAGGHLAAYLGVTGNAPETHGAVGDHDETSSAVTCVVDFFGPTDFLTMPLERANLARNRLFGEGEHEKKMKHASPMAFVDAKDPPILIVHGTEDNLVPIEQSDRFAAKLKEAGVTSELIRVEGAGHGINEQAVLKDVIAFFDEHLGGNALETLERIMAEQQRQQEERQRQLEERRRQQQQQEQPRNRDGGGDAARDRG